MTSRPLAFAALLTATFAAVAGKTYTPQQLNAMVNSGKYPAQGSARTMKNEPLAFPACKLTIQRMESQIRGSYPVKTIVDSSIMYTVKFWTNDGAITATCSKPDGKMVMTQAPYK